MNSRSMQMSALAALALVVPLANCDCEGEVAAIKVPKLTIIGPDGTSSDDADPWLVVGFPGGQSASSQTLQLKNAGGARLEFTNACLVNASALDEALLPENPCILSTSAAYQFPPLAGQEIQPNTSQDFEVAFVPESSGSSRLFLRFQTNEENPYSAIELVAPSGQLCADNAIVDFGDVQVGDSKTETITLTSCGIEDVSIAELGMILNPDDAFAVSLSGGQSVPVGPLSEGASVEVEATFAPQDVRVYRDSLAGQVGLKTAAPYERDYNILLMGNGVAAPSCRVNVIPQTLNFGAVASGASATQNVILQSVGECACTVSDIGVPMPAAANFTLGGSVSAPLVLKGTRGCDSDPDGAAMAPGRVEIPVVYTAPSRQNPAADNATMTVVTTDAETPMKVVNLEANGGGTPYCELEVTPEGSGGFIPVQGRYGVVKFGRVTVHYTKRSAIELRNVGNADCVIDSVEYKEAANTLQNEFGLEYADGTPVNVGATAPITVQPGDTAVFMATFTPTRTIEADNPLDVFSFGSYSASDNLCGFIRPNERCNGVIFRTNDSVTPDTDGVMGGDFSIGFSATPVEPAIDILPGEIDFGLVTVGCGSREQRVTIYNTGSGDLEINEPRIDPATTPAEFEITATNNPTGTWPYAIQPGNSMAVMVRFRAQRVGPHFADIVIPTLEGGQAGPEFTVSLAGEGTLETSQTDVFDQFSDPKVDVLWVVDDSGSMSPFQQQVADNFDQFFTASNVSGADFHIAVTTTLTADSSCIPDPFSGNTNCEQDEFAGYYTSCSGNDRYLSPASANPENQFRCNVNVSDSSNVNPDRDGSDSAEGGLQAARAFLSAPNIDDPAINGGFLRDDAKLHVIVVSDEPDQSEGPIDLYVDFFRNLKGFRNDSLVAVSAIAAPRNGCTLPNGESVSGDARYEDTVAALNGRFESICAQDWTSMMSNLGLDSLGLKIEYFLSRAADAPSLQVCVRAGGATDGTCVPQTQTTDGAANGYFYDAESNSIVFNPGSVPPRGARVEVFYETYCY